MKSAKKLSNKKVSHRPGEEDTGLDKSVTLTNNTIPPKTSAIFFDYKTYIKVSHGGLNK
jgi:hypothetical protein